MSIGQFLGVGALTLLLMAVFLTAYSWLTLFLWNHLMPVLFGLPKVSLLQSFGLIVLSRSLFGGFIMVK